MGQPNPFYQFSPVALNAGFETELSYKSDLLNSIFNEFTNGDYSGLFFQKAINGIKSVIANYNEGISGTPFVLGYPSPFPVIEGDQAIQFQIYNAQLKAANSGQVIEISLEMSNGIIGYSFFTFSEGPISYGSNYTPQIFSTENIVAQSLSVRNITGASFLPLVYKMNGSTAVSGLARLSNWIYNDALGYSQRFPVDAYPNAPQRLVYFESLTNQESYISNLVEQIINFGFGSDLTISDFTAYLVAINGSNQIPEGWNYTFADNGSTLIEIGFAGTDSQIAFRLVGQLDSGTWKFQRFITALGDTADEFIVTYAGDTLPYIFADNGTYFDQWYDFEYVCFNPNCPAENQFYGIPAKTGDQFQFNILPNQANLTGIESCKIGIVGPDEVFIQQVGTANLPSCFTNLDFTIELTESQVTDLLESFDDVIVFGSLCDGTDSFRYTVPFASLNQSNATAYGQSVVDYINGLSGDITGAFEVVGSGLNFTFSILSTSDLTISLTYNVGVFNSYSVETRCPEATQFQASVTIPFLADGCYNFILYNQDIYTSEIYAKSNAIKINNQDCFSVILEIGSKNPGELVEGFEYYGTWTQRIRLGLRDGAPVPQIEESTYRQSNGIFRRPANKSDLKLSLQTNYVDKSFQKAMFGATRHPVFILNGLPLFVIGDVNVNHTKDFTTEDSYFELSQMDFEALVQGFQPKNNTCLGC